jgi:AcrR family transcriptional regulator
MKREAAANAGRPARKLDAGRIAAAALRLVDAEGLSALSARRLATMLGCEAMSLYNHVANMGEVHDLIVDGLLKSLLDQELPKDDRKAVTVLAHSYLAIARAHPNAFPLIAMRRWRTPGALQFASSLLARLQSLGQSPREALRQLRVLSAYVHGAGMVLAAWQTPQDAPDPGAAGMLPASLSSALNATALRADLEAGLKSLLQARLG